MTENIGTLMLEKCLTNETNKNQQIKKGKEEFEEMLSGLLGLFDAIAINPLPEQQFIEKEMSEEGQLKSEGLVGNWAQLLMEGSHQEEAEKNLPQKAQRVGITSFNAVKDSLIADEKAAEQRQKAFPAEESSSKGAKLLKEELLFKQTASEDAGEFEELILKKAIIEDEDKFKDLIFEKTRIDGKEKFASDLEKGIKDTSFEQESTTVIQEDEIWQQTVFANTGDKIDTGETEIKLKAEHVPRDLPELVISKLKTFKRSDGCKELIVQLEPKELGKLVVKLTSVEGTVSVKILAHYPVTRDLLEGSLNSLRLSFAEQGIRFDRMDVELGGEQLNQSPYQHQEQQTWQQGRTNNSRRMSLETSGYFDGDFEQTTESSRLQTGTYDYLV